MKILIVDDDQMISHLLQLLLESEGHEAKSALNVKDGYLAYFKLRPDLVITDIQMPGENGFELITHIREKDPRVKTIYMSGNLDQYATAIEAEKTKYPIKFLGKPFSREDLIDRIDELSS